VNQLRAWIIGTLVWISACNCGASSNPTDGGGGVGGGGVGGGGVGGGAVGGGGVGGGGVAGGGVGGGGVGGGAVGGGGGGADAGVPGTFRLAVVKGSFGSLPTGTDYVSYDVRLADGGTCSRVGPNCKAVVLGPNCYRSDCPHDGGGGCPISKMPAAGTLFADAGTKSWTFGYAADQTLIYSSTPEGWPVSEGQVLVLTGSGGADIAPFTLSAVAPNIPSLIAPSPADGTVQISTAAGVSLALSAPANAPAFFTALNWDGFETKLLECSFPSGSQTFVVPGSHFIGMSGPGLLWLQLRNSSRTRVGDYDVGFGVYVDPGFVDGGYPSRASFQ